MVAAACGALVHRHGFVVLAAVGSTLVVGLAWPWAAVRSARVGLAFEADRGTVGAAVGCRVSVRNRGPFPAAGLVLRGLGNDGLPLPSVRPFGSAEVWVRFVPARRGVYAAAGTGVTCGLPLGLWNPGRGVAVGRPLLVWPDAEATPLPAAVRGRRTAPAEAAVAARLAGDAEGHGVRPYLRDFHVTPEQARSVDDLREAIEVVRDDLRANRLADASRRFDQMVFTGGEYKACLNSYSSSPPTRQTRGQPQGLSSGGHPPRIPFQERHP